MTRKTKDDYIPILDKKEGRWNRKRYALVKINLMFRKHREIFWPEIENFRNEMLNADFHDGDEKILTLKSIPNHPRHVCSFIEVLEMFREDWSTELLAEIAGRDITTGKPTVELRALRILTSRSSSTADPNLVENLLILLKQGASRARVRLEANNLLIRQRT